MQLIQISAAQGPVECCKAVAMALQCFTNEAKKAGVTLEVLEIVDGPSSGTYRSALLSLKGAGTAELIERWSGTVQWIWQSTFRPNHKRKNWFIGITSHTIKEDSSFTTSEIEFEAMRSNGPGGQHVNKTESAIRATHIASGLSVRVQSERSQHANKRIALLLLSHKLEEQKGLQADEQRTERWMQHYELERGNPILTFEGDRFKPV